MNNYSPETGTGKDATEQQSRRHNLLDLYRHSASLLGVSLNGVNRYVTEVSDVCNTEESMKIGGGDFAIARVHMLLEHGGS